MSLGSRPSFVPYLPHFRPGDGRGGSEAVQGSGKTGARLGVRIPVRDDLLLGLGSCLSQTGLHPWEAAASQTHRLILGGSRPPDPPVRPRRMPAGLGSAAPQPGDLGGGSPPKMRWGVWGAAIPLPQIDPKIDFKCANGFQAGPRAQRWVLGTRSHLIGGLGGGSSRFWADASVCCCICHLRCQTSD